MRTDTYCALPVIVATVALFWIVPESPLAHLDDPSHWGVLGYAATILVIGARAVGRISTAKERRWLVVFLAAMPMIYLADWVRFGGSMVWLAVELVGLCLYVAFAWLAVRRSVWFLPAGIAGHALWDGLHYDMTGFVPNWYVVGCLVVDVGIALYVAGGLGVAPPSHTRPA